MKKDKRILALVLAAAMMGTTALPVWAQTPETADSSVVEVEGTLENIIAARGARGQCRKEPYGNSRESKYQRPELG